MKKLLLVLSGIVSITTLLSFTGGGNDTMDTSGGPAGYAGDPAGGNKTCGSSGGCHSGAPIGTVNGVITSNIPVAGYTAGSTYTVTANFIRPGHSKFGFQITPQNTSGMMMGSMAILTAQTKLVGTSKYVTHTSTGTAGSGSKSWSFKWTAPMTGMGPVTFYGVFNATNNNSSDTGDSIFRSTTVVTENTTGIQNPEANSFHLSTFPNPTTDNLNIKFTLEETSSVQANLMDINGNKVADLINETEMSGEVTRSFDISGYTQGIYFVRLRTSSGEVIRKIVKM